MVIQRWQSVLLLIATIVMAIFTFSSLGQVQLTDYSLNFTCMGFSVEGESTGNAISGYVLRTWALFIISIMSFALPFINIFLFKNLNLQKRLCLISILFVVAATVIGCYFGYYAFAPQYVSWSSVVVAPLVALIAEASAYNRINADQKLLKAADRIR